MGAEEEMPMKILDGVIGSVVILILDKSKAFLSTEGKKQSSRDGMGYSKLNVLDISILEKQVP